MEMACEMEGLLVTLVKMGGQFMALAGEDAFIASQGTPFAALKDAADSLSGINARRQQPAPDQEAVRLWQSWQQASDRFRDKWKGKVVRMDVSPQQLMAGLKVSDRPLGSNKPHPPAEAELSDDLCVQIMQAATGLLPDAMEVMLAAGGACEKLMTASTVPALLEAQSRARAAMRRVNEVTERARATFRELAKEAIEKHGPIDHMAELLKKMGG